MDALLGFAGHLLKELLFSFVFYWPGWLAVKIITFGRYPRSLNPVDNDWLGVEVLSVIGLVVVVALGVFILRVWP
ncbi:hypothetical protein [Hydrogenophaga sp. BPS33]|uniref:hypothetical protein n=1 Tax=Hydrogenophaga sp. BPS33 TaxID=2651974 RepID=UPI00131F88FC|nr:hypothetical protein [Hydrogenophaga sp. BPS33]QHE88583.1 hypothetical protein F9K07_28715 [Hydrogenophaga sp. BPS33]